MIIKQIMDSENVKERLTTMLHKKLSDLQERESRATKYNELSESSIKQEEEDNKNTPSETNVFTVAEANNSVDVQEDYIPLQEILDEKKRALLRNKEVIKFLQSKK